MLLMISDSNCTGEVEVTAAMGDHAGPLFAAGSRYCSPLSSLGCLVREDVENASRFSQWKSCC